MESYCLRIEKKKKKKGKTQFFFLVDTDWTWSYFKAIRLNGRLRFELLHPVDNFLG